MTDEYAIRGGSRPFGGVFDSEHRRVDPCFMTGKGCVYTEVIDRAIKDRRLKRDDEAGRYIGFSVMPFRKNLDVFFRNCLEPYFKGAYNGSIILQHADEVRRPGIIICEGICKRIQESDFVTIDVSLPNPNVFYELGLAYGMGHKIVVIRHQGAPFGEEMADHLQRMGCHSFAYHDLDPISKDDIDRSQNVWRNTTVDPDLGQDPPRMLFYEHHLGERKADYAERNASGANQALAFLDQEDIQLSFETHVLSGVGLAIARICGELEEAEPATQKYKEIINGLMEVVPVKTDSQFKDIKAQVESAYCMIIRTGFRQCHPMAYFWLGYGHARGKHVIPVTVINDRDDKVDDLAFDIRAQRHMIFIQNTPDRFEHELTSSLRQMILTDFSEWSRRRFWDRLLGKRGEVSIFTGALHAKDFGREMIGDWDLRVASELTSYFALQQYRATIENPVYTPEYPGIQQSSQQPENANWRTMYIDRLKGMMAGKNCILIASPDVNPLTEIALGTLYNVPDEQLFTEGEDIAKYPNAMVVFKEKPETVEPKVKRFFYRESHQDSDRSRRGFESAQLVDGKLLETFESQLDVEVSEYDVFGHIVIMPNRFGDEPSDKYIIVLNGVSGPATFALTHVLTGGVTKEFVSYGNEFNPEAESEDILRQILDMIRGRPFQSVDCIINVKVGRSRTNEERVASNISDWRRILSWQLNEQARQQSIEITDMRPPGR